MFFETATFIGKRFWLIIYTYVVTVNPFRLLVKFSHVYKVQLKEDIKLNHFNVNIGIT